MKKFFKAMLAVLVCSVCFLTACGPTGLGNNPSKELEAIGNGGLAVVKGEYLYFVNGYQDYKEYTDVTKDNKFGKITRSGIYRTKLVDGKVVRDENGFVVETECVVPHTVGFDKGGFYIVGDYIYYLTPHMENGRDENNDKVLKSDWSDICRIKIDGTGQKRLAYTTSDSRVSDWSVYTIDGKTYVVLLDGDKLISVNGESGETITMASGVTSAKLCKQENFEFGKDDLINKYIYYTREYTEADAENGEAGNKLCKVEINSTEEKLVVCDAINNYAIIENVNDYVYYTKVKDDTTVTWNKSMYRRQATDDGVEELVTGNYASYLIINNQNSENVDNNLITVDANNYMYLISNGARKLIYTGAGSITLIGEDDNKVYFVEDSAIYALDYVADAEPVKISNSDKTYMLDNANLIDIDGRRIFVMAEYTAEDESKHYYLNVIDRYDTETKSEFVGEFADNETPAEPEEIDEDEILEEEPSLWVE